VVNITVSVYDLGMSFEKVKDWKKSKVFKCKFKIAFIFKI